MKVLTLKVHEIKTAYQNLFKSSEIIKRYILIICSKLQRQKKCAQKFYLFRNNFIEMSKKLLKSK